MAEQISTSISISQEPKKWFNFMASLKSLFQKNKKWDKAGGVSKVFNLTRKDAIVSVCIAVLIVIWSIFYWMKVWNNYTYINSGIESLKELSTFNIKIDDKNLSENYWEWKWITTISSLISVYDNIKEEIADYETFEKKQSEYYEVLLQHLYLPSINVWKDPYTKNFDVTILWQKYLDADKFQDLYLFQYWSDFFKYVWNDADYNEIKDITVWDKVILNDDPNYFYTPISISFISPNKRSFLLLVNKLSITSNQSNISLLNEFFFYLLNNIKTEKASEINELMKEYLPEFSSSTDWKWAKSIDELTEEQENKYKDMVIGYNLYHWIQDDGIVKNSQVLVNDSIIEKTISQAALCSSSETKPNQKCFYAFRDKYRDIPYLAYNIGMENQGNRTSWLLNFLRDLPPAIAITNFQFEKYSESTFLNNEEEKYEWSVTFNAFGRNITQDELDEAASFLWKLCLWANTEEKISTELALSRVNDFMVSLWWNRQFSNVYTLWELKGILEEIQNSYNSMTNYDKMVKIFEIRRMLNDADLCEQQ